MHVTPNATLPSGRKFNDDLLTNLGDIEHAKHQFPELIHVLDHPGLRSVFAEYEKRANKARASVRRWGFFAVVSATAALLSTASEPFWHHFHYSWWFSIVFECGTLLAALIAVGGLCIGKSKEDWLECRLMTERLRQWHFQLLVRRMHEIEESCDSTNPAAVATFQERRGKWFAEFMHSHTGKLDSQLVSICDQSYDEDWLHPAEAHPGAGGAVLARIFEAYQRLRFAHQQDFANHKLKESKELNIWRILKWPLLRQQAAIRAAVASCFVGALICSAAVIVNRVFELRPSLDKYLGIVALSVAIIGVAFRTIQDGLGVSKDIDRYRDYRGKVRRLMVWFEATADPQIRLRLMEEMELAVVDEMRDFLRVHQEAAFVL